MAEDANVMMQQRVKRKELSWVFFLQKLMNESASEQEAGLCHFKNPQSTQPQGFAVELTSPDGS